MRRPAVLLASLGLVLGCGSASPDVVTPSAHSVHALPDPGKADNYYSTNAQEYLLSGVAHVALPEDFAALVGEARDQRLTSLVATRESLVVRTIQDHIKTVVAPKNGEKTGEEAEYFIYVKRDPGTTEAPEVLEDGRARFAFTFELIGHTELIQALSPSGKFSVEVKEWPAPTGETVEVSVRSTPSTDSFPRYDELFRDGSLDIGVHFGGDYNKERHDIETAKWMVETLLENGFKNEAVTSYDTLAIESPAFTRTLVVEGKPVAVNVWVYHSDLVPAEREEELRTVMKESLAKRDIVIYSGHAGEGAGFILDYQPKLELTPAEFATVEMASKYQIFVLDGCRTYRTYVDDLMKNPAKSFDNLNIITTVNTTPFSVGYQVLWEMVFWLTLTDDAGNHFPLSWNALLAGVNTDEFKTVHYGVHGVDNGPKLNPHGGKAACTPCSGDGDCGAGGNLCLGYGGASACGVACTVDAACPEGYKCQAITDDPEQFYLPRQCVNSAGQCR